MCSKVLGRTQLLLMLSAVAVSAGSACASFTLPDGVDLWFSTSTPAISLKNSFQYLGPGSVLSTNGSVIMSNQTLIGNFKPFGAWPALFNDKGIDAIAITGSSRRKTIVFSTTKGFYSTALHRYISDGDLLNNRGQMVATQQELLAALAPRNPNTNYGLDAAYIRGTDPQGHMEIWFSTDRSFYSQTLGRTITSGDIVSNTGELIASAGDLLKAFAPKGSTSSLGVDSFSALLDDKGQVSSYLFSTTKSFYSNTLKRQIGANDLLSSDGTIAMTQADLTKNFGLIVPVCGSLHLNAAAFNRPTGEERRTPEPATLGLLTLGLFSLVRRRK